MWHITALLSFALEFMLLHSLSAQGSTGGSEVPAYDRCYILATDIYVIMFRAVCIRIYYAMLIATPEAVLSLAQVIYCNIEL